MPKPLPQECVRLGSDQDVGCYVPLWDSLTHRTLSASVCWPTGVALGEGFLEMAESLASISLGSQGRRLGWRRPGWPCPWSRLGWGALLGLRALGVPGRCSLPSLRAQRLWVPGMGVETAWAMASRLNPAHRLPGNHCSFNLHWLWK